MAARLDFIKLVRETAGVKAPKDVVQKPVEKPELKRNEYFHIFKKVSWCPTSGCPGTFRYKNDRRFKCKMCNKDYCLDCRYEFHEDFAHEGMDCNLNQQKIAADLGRVYQPVPKYKAGEKFRVCTRCKSWVQKPNEELGLDNAKMLICDCKNTFCYLCGMDHT